MLFSRFLKEIENDQFLQEKKEVLVAVSGGADSVCLLHLMTRLRDVLNIHLVCVHVNHMLRPNANEDALFVEDLCNKWKVSFIATQIDVGLLAKEKKISVELAGREARYAYFKSLGKDVILTAHTMNDSAESILLHLIRGCALPGLCGIPRIREDNIYRPLLCFTRAEIELYLTSHQISWREDESNHDSKYSRNKIRNEIIPIMLQMNPSLFETMERMASLLKDENSYIEDALSHYSWKKEIGDTIFISVTSFNEMPGVLKKRALSKLFNNEKDINSVLSLLNKENGKRVSISGGLLAEKDYNEITIFPSNKLKPLCQNLPEFGELVFGEYVITVGDEGLALPKNEYIVRCRKQGEWFSPEGMQGRKKIKEYLNDKKIPLRLRDSFPIITFDDKIAAVGDLRRDGLFVPKDNNIIHVKIQQRGDV